LETTANASIDRLRRVFTHLRRVVTPTGTLWLNLGDSYATNSDGYWCAQPGQPGQPRYRPVADLPVKNLLGMPWRVALALQADGLVLRNAIIWHKPNATPTPVADRLTCRHELLFLFTLGPRYYFDLNAIREPHTTANRTGPRRSYPAGSTSSMRAGQHVTMPGGIAGLPLHPGGRNPGDVWSIATRPTRRGHPAAFPVQIPLRAIAAGCPPGGVVLDPFSGIATTGVAARHLGRAYVGIDLNPRFQAIGAARLAEFDVSTRGGAR
jgi:site-specific DNA-methyltransferase (cytosine-N4-specific)